MKWVIETVDSRRSAHIEAEHLSKGSQEILGLQ
jgi:hypothetical protein